MSLKLHKVISLLNEHADPIMNSQTYNDIIHGRQELVHDFADSNLEDVPIKLSMAKWVPRETDSGEVLFRSFDFLNFQTLFYFVSESLKLQERLNHHCIMTIDELAVEITAQTKNVQEVTELDLELSEKIDDIYEDTQYFHSVKRGRSS